MTDETPIPATLYLYRNGTCRTEPHEMRIRSIDNPLPEYLSPGYEIVEIKPGD